MSTATTQRYRACQDYFSQRITFYATFSKYGMGNLPYERVSCLTNLVSENKQLEIDHVWIKSDHLLSAKLRTNQPIKIRATIRPRKRINIETGELTLDIYLSKVKLL
jgi:hypothetical protein